MTLPFFLVLGFLACQDRALDREGIAFFEQKIRPVLVEKCYACHSARAKKLKANLYLDSRPGLLRGGDRGPAITAGNPDRSLLIRALRHSDEELRMPPKGKLPDRVIRDFEWWIRRGAPDPRTKDSAEARRADPKTFWSFQPLKAPEVPRLENDPWPRTPIDRFILARLREEGLVPRPEADRRTLLRRLTFDLIGLPPTPEEMTRFLSDPDPKAYEKEVDRLLALPRYGERWARHWLDVVHYGDTHGFDKDKVRKNAWPYRDYVIQSLNANKPYDRFVREQLAGDVLYPGDPEGIVATGFIAAGPWDFVGHVEVRNGTVEKKRVRVLDRDDMVSATMNTFTSLTVHCARCHNHKFDPITQDDYYSLQTVFAAVDRADRPVEDRETSRKRARLADRRRELESRKRELEKTIRQRGGERLTALEKKIASEERAVTGQKRPEFGYHSAIESRPDAAKWVQVDLEESVLIDRILLAGCHDSFNGIGVGFGFPVRYRVEISEDPQFRDALRVHDHEGADARNPGITPQTIPVRGKKARYVRVTATRLAPRKDDFIFALAELEVLTAPGRNVALHKNVRSLDSIEAPVRWRRTNLVDGIYPGKDARTLKRLRSERENLLGEVLTPEFKSRREKLEEELRRVDSLKKALPKPRSVYAAATRFPRQGNFVPTEGRPRAIHVLGRGSVTRPGKLAKPGSVAFLNGAFHLEDPAAPGARRSALAEWIVSDENPLTWRSIVNRVWLYHFGQGLVSTPNDFGFMGSRPTHPRLLDWLAAEFRDGTRTLKELHRRIVNSAVYRQSSRHDPAMARIDGDNRYLWRMNRRRLSSEAFRDAVLSVSGKLDLSMYGPGFRAFGFKDDHSPHYKYHEYDPDDPKTWRRSVYRFVVRSVPDPFMTTLDGADPSELVARRNETVTPLQALALMNNPFMIRMAEHFAARLAEAVKDPIDQIRRGYALAVGREPSEEEAGILLELARKHGLSAVCRMILNTNEFVFVD